MKLACDSLVNTSGNTEINVVACCTLIDNAMIGDKPIRSVLPRRGMKDHQEARETPSLSL